MGEAIGATLGFAVGIAISPIPVAAAILMLFSDRARTNATAFGVGWVVGIAAVASIVAALPGVGTDTGEPSSSTGWIKLVLGLLLLLVAVRQWRGRPTGDDEPPVPGWMARIDDLRPGAAVGLGLALSAVNPKNLLLGAAAGASLAALDLPTGQAVGAIVVYTVVAAATVAVPVAAYLVAGARLDPLLERTKEWLIANNSVVLAVLLVVFGVNLLGDALQILT